MSFHTNDRSITWYDKSKSDMKSDYNVYGVTLLNEVGKSFEAGNNVKITPFAGLEVGYMTHEGFEESGGPESLKIDSNNGYSIKPSIGVKLEGEKAINNLDWKLKGNIGAAYEYELGNMNRQEKATLDTIEEGYHKLAQPSEDKGSINTAATIGMEFQDRFGIFLTGEYKISDDSENDYRVGMTFKTVF